MKWWPFTSGGSEFEACGPYRDPNGIIVGGDATGQIAWAESIGGRIPTQQQLLDMWVQAKHAIVVRLNPFPNARFNPPLTTLHGYITRMLAEAGDPGASSVMCGKSWIRHHWMTASVAVNYGLFVPVAEVVHRAGEWFWQGIECYPTGHAHWYALQSPGKRHGYTHRDWSQLWYAVRDAGTPTKRSTPGAMRSIDIPKAPAVPGDMRDTDPAPALPWHAGIVLGELSLAERTLVWSGYQFGLDVHEIPGPRHSPEILDYSKHCRRGGTFLGLDASGHPAWDGGFSVALRTDDADSPWCAAMVSGGLVACLLPGEAPPHGLRVSVRELCDDARGTLRLMPPNYVPQPGDLMICPRLGENPVHGGRGHVRKVVFRDGETVRCIGGNESTDEHPHGDANLAWHPRSEAVAWISYQGIG